jgi:TolB protein
MSKISTATAILTLLLLFIYKPVLSQENNAYGAAKHGGNYMHNFYLPPAPSSSPWAPDWAPDGESIAVAMSGSIWKVDVKSAAAEELTYNEKYHSAPDWSPDGKWIVYTADDGGQTIQLEILNVATGEISALTNDEHLYTDPVFSPDGSKIAYVSTKPNGYLNIYVRDFKNGYFDGPEVPLTYDNSYGKNRLYFGEWDMHLSPAWLPNGEELLIVSNRRVPLGSGNVLRVPIVENGIDQAKTVLREQTLYRARPDVSVDGRRFVYSSTRGAADQFNNLYVQPTIDGEPYKLTFFDHDAFHPRWSPDGEWIAYITNKDGLPQLALLETYGGKQIDLAISKRSYKRNMGLLSVTPRKSTSGDTAAVRVLLTASDGKFYAPTNAYARVGGARDDLFHVPGRFEVRLPTGKATLTLVKGFEFLPQTVEVNVKADSVTSISVDMERMADMESAGWYGGSTHVHMNYGGNLHNTLQNLMMMSDAEDQDIVNEQVANKDNRIIDHQFFVPGGGPHPLSTPERVLVVGQEYRPPFYGHVFMFGMNDHLISPFTTGYEGTAIESLYPSNTDMLRKAKSQGATVGYVHSFFGENDPLEETLGGAKGFMVDAALETTDAVEWASAARAGFYPVYAVWNNGLTVTAVGGEDSISNLHSSKLVGSVRTYVYTGDSGLSMQSWFEGLKNGHAFVTTGPLLELTVDGAIAGETVKLADSGSLVKIKARVRSITPLSKVWLVFNGETIRDIPLGENRNDVLYDGFVEVTESGWFHLRAEGDPSARFPLDADYAQAFTNPVWVLVGGTPIRDAASADYSLRWIDKLQAMAEDWPGWRSQKEKNHVYQQFDAARAVYQQFRIDARALKGESDQH